MKLHAAANYSDEEYINTEEKCSNHSREAMLDGWLHPPGETTRRVRETRRHRQRQRHEGNRNKRTIIFICQFNASKIARIKGRREDQPSRTKRAIQVTGRLVFHCHHLRTRSDKVSTKEANFLIKLAIKPVCTNKKIRLWFRMVWKRGTESVDLMLGIPGAAVAFNCFG